MFTQDFWLYFASAMCAMGILNLNKVWKYSLTTFALQGLAVVAIGVGAFYLIGPIATIVVYLVYYLIATIYYLSKKTSAEY